MTKTRVRTTSFEAYREIRDRGLLSPMRWRVYACLYGYGPFTSAELDEHMRNPKELRPGYHKRLSELRGMEVVQEVGERECRVTGRNAIVWDVTDRLPVKLDKKTQNPRPPKKELREALEIIKHWQRQATLAGEPDSTAIRRLVKWLEVKCQVK